MPTTGNEFVEVLRNSLTRFRDEAERFVSDQGLEPVAGSAAAIERPTYARPQSPLTVAGIATLLIESVGEHVTAFVKTITEPVEPIACWTCVRSMLESASIAAWLFDPKIQAQKRAGRAYALRYEGPEEQVKVGRAANLQAGELKNLEDVV